MHPDALRSACELLRCPICAAPLGIGDAAVRGAALRCAARHTFDISRYGYISLLTGAKPTSGDDAEMARARERFLASGAYEPLRTAIVAMAAEALTDAERAGSGCAGSDRAGSDRAGTAPTPSAPTRHDPVVLDVGAGTGHYLAGVLDALPTARGIALDTSVRALRVAARAHPRAVAATWDVFSPFPLADASADVVLDVFSPRNPPEFRRVLAPHGRLIVARPTQRHLAELRAEVSAMVGIDPAKEERLTRALAPHVDEVRTELVETRIALDASQLRDLVGMTPSARHLDPAALAADGSGLTVTLSVLVSAYSPRS